MERTLIPIRDRKGATFITSRDRTGARISMIRSAGGRLAIADHLSTILVRDGEPERWGRPR